MPAAYADAMPTAVGQPICSRDDEGMRPAGLSLPQVTTRNHVSWLAGFGTPGRERTRVPARGVTGATGRPKRHSGR